MKFYLLFWIRGYFIYEKRTCSYFSMNFTSLVRQQIRKTKIWFVNTKVRHVAWRNLPVPVHADQLSKPLDLSRNGQTRLILESSPGKTEMAGDGRLWRSDVNGGGGSDDLPRQRSRRRCSAPLRGHNGVLGVVLSVPGQRWMETVSSGETPTRNYGRTGDLQMG
jgi:hypothetical protein